MVDVRGARLKLEGGVSWTVGLAVLELSECWS